MALDTNQYGYLIDPLVPITDATGRTIKDGFLRVFIAGSSTPVITYRNFDESLNEKTIELDNSGRCKYPIIVNKSLAYKVVVYDAQHSQETPIITVDKLFAIGASVTVGAGATVVTGIDGLTTKPDGFVDASVVGTDGYVALDHNLVDDDLDTDAKVTAVEDDRYIPLLNEDVNDPDSKITLGRLWQWVLGKIKSLSTTITAFRTGDVIPVDGPSGTAKMSKDDLLKETANNALANKVAPLFDASSTYNVGDRVIYNGVQYRCTTPHTGAFNLSNFTITTSSYEDYVLGINFAPKFSTSTNYRKGELVTLGGSLWRFKVAHSAGAWDVSEMELVNVANLYALQVNRRFVKMLTNSGFEQGRFDINGVYSGFSSTSPDYIKWCSHRNLLNLTSAKILKITQSSGYNADVFLQTYTVTTDSDYNDTFTKSTRYQYSVKSGVDFYIDVSAIEYGRLSFNVNSGIPCITTDIEVSLEFTPYTSLPADEKNYYEDLPNSDNLSGRCVVNQQGDGDYTDIGTAYNANRTGSNPALIDIIVQNGAYDWVNVAKLWAKGETRDYTIIRNTSASYPYAASMIGIGIIDTFTFYAHNSSPNKPAYALHIDLERNKNERGIYRNCRFISTRNCAIGVGMTKGYALWFEDCEFLSHSTTDAGAFFHDARASLGEGNYGGLQWLTFVRCKFKSKSEFALRILSVESSNKLIVTFIDCTFESDITANQNSVRICGTTTEGYLCGDSILLGSKSHGNNVDLLNAW